MQTAAARAGIYETPNSLSPLGGDSRKFGKGSLTSLGTNSNTPGDDYRVEDWAIRGRAKFPLNPRNTAEILELEIYNKACDWQTYRVNVWLVAVRLGQLEIYRTATTGTPLDLRSLVIQHEDNDSHFDRPCLHPAGSPRQFKPVLMSRLQDDAQALTIAGRNLDLIRQFRRWERLRFEWSCRHYNGANMSTRVSQWASN